jgi:hypothetical protein
MPTSVVFDPDIGRQLVKHARLVAARGYVQHAERIIYPTRADRVMQEEAAE